MLLGAAAATGMLLQMVPLWLPSTAHRAEAYSGPLVWSNLAALVTGMVALAGLYLLLPEEKSWLRRSGWLLLVLAVVQAVRLPNMVTAFWWSREFGLSSQAWAGWWRNYLLGLLVPAVLLVLKGLLVIATIARFPRQWWWVGAVSVFLLFGLVAELVSLREPVDLVEQISPLPAGEHATTLNAVLTKAGKPLPIRVLDQSRRANTSSICLTGRLGREYVLVTDTFLQRYTPVETALALAHELGHADRRVQWFVMEQAMALATLLLGYGLAYRLAAGTTGLRVFVLALLCVRLVSVVARPAANALSRYEERLADRHAMQLMQNPSAYQQLLLKAAAHDLEPLTMPRWRYLLTATHPTVSERMAAIQE